MEKVRLNGIWQRIKQMIAMETTERYEKTYGDMQRGIECMEFSAGDPILLSGYQLQYRKVDDKSQRSRYPIGVIGGISYL